MKIDTSTYEWTTFFEKLEALQISDEIHYVDTPIDWFRVILYREGYHVMWRNPTTNTGLGRILRTANEVKRCIEGPNWFGAIITY